MTKTISLQLNWWACGASSRKATDLSSVCWWVLKHVCLECQAGRDGGEGTEWPWGQQLGSHWRCRHPWAYGTGCWKWRCMVYVPCLHLAPNLVCLCVRNSLANLRLGELASRKPRVQAGVAELSMPGFRGSKNLHVLLHPESVCCMSTSTNELQTPKWRNDAWSSTFNILHEPR